MTILLDFESRSRCDLKKHGGRLYWAHHSTEAICCVLFDTETGDVGLWLPGMPCPFEPDDVLGAHNATGFDRFGCERLGWRSASDPRWVDTSELARKAGLPGALDALGQRWLGIAKDKEGNRLVQSLSRPSRAKARLGQLPDITPEILSRVVAYCASDVEIMAHGWALLEPWLDVDAEVARVERLVNDRGVGFDVELATRLLEEDAANAEAALVDASRALQVTATYDRSAVDWTPEHVRAVVQSPAQFTALAGVENAQAETIDGILDGTIEASAYAVPLARARRALASIARGKLEAGLSRVSADGRLRDSHRYYGAHTGRWSGRGMQLQNMPRPAKAFEEWSSEQIEALADEVLEDRRASQDEIDLLLRACLVAKPGHVLLVRDFAGVEARGLAWVAGDHEAVRIFREGKLDVYKRMASVIFSKPYDSIAKGVERTVGKIAELACGYGMGSTKFELTAAKAGVNLREAGVDPDDVVKAWRKLHRPIVEFWYAVEAAMLEAAEGEEASASCFTFVPSDDGRDVAAFLPSGRPIVYNDVRVVRDEKNRKRLAYQGARGTEHTYGGKIAENLVQAMCRDLMAEALVNCEHAGLCPVMHVHDEIVCEVREARADLAEAAMAEIFTALPAWADGFPIGAAGHRGRRYRK